MKRATILVAAALLTTGTAAMAQSDSEGREDARQEKRICKNEKVTGSLTRVRRTCLTQREWDRQAELARRNADVLDDDGNATTREVLLAPMRGAGG